MAPRDSVTAAETATTAPDARPAPPTEVPVPDRGRGRGGRRLGRGTIVLVQVGIVGALLAIWQLAHVNEWVRPLLLSSPGEVWAAGQTLADTGTLWLNLWATVKAAFIALVIAGAFGIVIGLSLALTPQIERAVTPFLSALNSAPRIAFAPVFIVMFGITMSAKVALAFSIVIFVMISAARAGVHAADPDTVRLMEVMGATKPQIFLKLLLPVAVPSIFAGLRLGLIYAFLGVVASEMISAKDGMGQLVAQYSASFQLDYVYAVIIVLIAATTTLNGAMGLLERRLLSWQPAKT